MLKHPIAYGLIVGALSLFAFGAHAFGLNDLNPVEQAKKTADVLKKAAPNATVTPPTLTQAPGFKLEKDGYSISTPTNPIEPLPRTQGPDNTVLGQALNLNDKLTHPAGTVASEAGKQIEKAVEDEANKIIETLKARFWAKVDELEKKAMPYLYLAAAALFAILMLPGLIGALLAIWIVRVLDRRTARKRQRELKEAIAMVKSQADEIDTKLAA
jgi:hypothetical protein